MSVIKAIGQYAKDLAADLKKGAANAEAELREIDRRRLAAESRLKLARLTDKRFLKFQPQIGTEYQCPRCWIVDERASALRPISGTDTEDRFRCPVCHTEYPIPFR